MTLANATKKLTNAGATITKDAFTGCTLRATMPGGYVIGVASQEGFVTAYHIYSVGDINRGYYEPFATCHSIRAAIQTATPARLSAN